jgi:hypothetical protein
MDQIEADREADRPVEAGPEDRGLLVALDTHGLGQAPAFPVSRDQPTGLGDIVSRRQSQDQPAEERPPGLGEIVSRRQSQDQPAEERPPERAAAEEPPEEAQQQQQPDTAQPDTARKGRNILLGRSLLEGRQLHQDRQDGKRHEAEVGQTAQDQLHRASSR